MAEIIHNSIGISGKVQGVFFRASTRKIALELGIKGWVRNEPDGTVKIEAEGTEEQLAKLLSWCNRGPEGASVSRVLYEPETVMGFDDFDIR